MTCPSCGQRKGRRACPALGQTICSVCCGTKRLAQIHCPADCPHLATAREHPPAVVRRQQDRDFAVVMPTVSTLTERQFELFFLLHGVIARHRPDAISGLIDDDVAEAAGSIAARYETAARGVLYDHTPESAVAKRLAVELKGLLDELGKRGGRSFEREAAPVLRSIERGARTMREASEGGPRAYLLVMARLFQGSAAGPAPEARTPSSLIVP